MKNKCFLQKPCSKTSKYRKYTTKTGKIITPFKKQNYNAAPRRLQNEMVAATKVKCGRARMRIMATM